jgi:signal peptidase I
MEASMPSNEDVRLALAAGVLRGFGELRFRAYGGSMIPTIFPGDVLLVGKESMANIRRGHVILFLREGRFCAHRVVRVEDRGERCSLITQGDALIAEDPAVSEDEFLGRVSAVIRDRLQFKLPQTPSFGKRLFGWAFQRSDFLASSFLRWHKLRARFTQESNAPVCANRDLARKCM